MNRTSTIKCDLIPSCMDCRLNTNGNISSSCEVGMPQYIPEEQVDRMLQEFKKKNYI